ncbi:MAG: hypothetical protein IPO92_02685 [Saprospiraceae bacterium]|nr:hypothetical protein [Saprospiraceae bacterium]
MNSNFTKFYFINFIILICCLVLQGQQFSFDNPYVNNYKKSEYKGGTENWDVVTSPNGIVYFANNNGLLTFDGTAWMLHSLPNKTIVRSIALDSVNQRIYVGGQDEVGYFEATYNGELQYKSLKNLLPVEFKSLEDIWDIQVINSKVYFRSINKIFIYHKNSIIVVPTVSTTINFIKYFNGILYYGNPNRGLFKIKDGIETFVPGSEIFKNHKITDILQLTKTSVIIITEKNGIFEYDNKVFKPFLKNQSLKNAILTTGVNINANSIGIATVLQGIIFVDTTGQTFYKITKKQGLQNNNVISICMDNDGNIWAGTSNGIDQILINAPYSIIYPDKDLQGGVYAVKLYDNKLYIGTNNGLFYTFWPKSHNGVHESTFKLVENTEGQVWSLDIVQGSLFMGHNEGAFHILHDKAKKISNDFIGTWRFIELNKSDVMITATYSGFQLFRKINNKWIFVKNLPGFSESARIIARDKSDNIWVSHPYRGVYKLSFKADFTDIISARNYGKLNGLPSDLANYVVGIKDDIYVNAEKGIYIYNYGKDVFEEASELTNILGKNISTRRLFYDVSGIWYVNENDCGIIYIHDTPMSKKIEKQSTPFLLDKLIGGFENIYTSETDDIFVCTDKGLIRIDIKKLQKSASIHLRFTNITSNAEPKRVIYGGYGKINDTLITFKSTENNITFQFTTSRLDNTDPIKYSHQLVGFDKKWSEWSYKTIVDFNNLSPGSYKLHVKAIDSRGQESNEISYSFKILSPWYASILARIFYFMIFILTLGFYIKYIDKKHESEKIILKQDIEESEAKVEELLNDKLQTEITFKNKELALSTMHIVQKNETLSKLRDELDNILHVNESDTKKQIKKVISILSDDQKLENDWDSFAVHFDQVHTDFLRRLKEKYPKLSPQDLKLCAYLRMNLTTKDIAPLFNISVRGVEISRYRLRKKMSLDVEMNLNDFMMQF